MTEAPFKLWPVGTLRPSVLVRIVDGVAVTDRPERPGRVMPDGPFGCYYSGPGEWVLLHLASGLAMPGEITTLRQCQDIAEALLASDSGWTSELPDCDPRVAREVLSRFIPTFNPTPVIPAMPRRRVRARR